MELIGRGQFSTVYRKNSSTVLIKSTDPVKECMALGWFPSCRLFPKIKRINCELYESKYYPRVRSLKNSLEPKQWELYKALIGCMSWDLIAELEIKSLHHGHDNPEWWIECHDDDCPVNPWVGDSCRETAKERWNTRHPDPLLEELAGALEKALDHGLFKREHITEISHVWEKYQQSKVHPKHGQPRI